MPARAPRRGTPPDDMTLAIFKAFGANPVPRHSRGRVVAEPTFRDDWPCYRDGLLQRLETKHSTLR